MGQRLKKRIKRLPAAKIITSAIDGTSREYLLEEGTTLQIGRAEGNELRIPSPKVSRFHAAIRSTDTGVLIQDLGSLNGTFLNGKLVGSTAELKSGDRVVVSGFEFLVELYKDDAPRPKNDETKPVDLQAYRGSLLVSDIRGYTRLSEELPAQELASVLRVWTERVTGVVQMLDGVIDKFNGDSVLAYWLRPSNSDDRSDAELAEKCFAAAKRIESETLSLESSVLWPFSPKYRWTVKSSIASGEVIFGNLGRGEARSFTVVGDTVNIVFRMNDLCSELGRELLADEATAKLMESSQKFRFLQSVNLEGRREPVKIYSLRTTEVMF